MVKKRKTSVVRSARTGRTGVTFEDLTVSDILNKHVQSTHLDMPADKVAGLLLKVGGAVPIVDKTKHLLGVVSEHDLLVSLDEEQVWSAQTAKDIMSGNPYSARPETNLATLVHVLKRVISFQCR